VPLLLAGTGSPGAVRYLRLTYDEQQTMELAGANGGASNLSSGEAGALPTSAQVFHGFPLYL
jgi:hypothetical protein